MQHPSFASLIAGLSVLVTASAVFSAAADQRPNVVVILADDLGYADIGVHGARDIPTPHIDRLAAGGMQFTNGYVTWVACAPSRASLLTGQDSHRFGFYTNPTPVLARDQGLPPGIMTVPRALQQRGYITGGIGKWHLGTTDDRHPNRLGFTEWFGFLGGGHDYFPRAYYGTPPPRPWPEHFVNSTLPILRNREPVKQDRYLTDMFSDEAVAFIRRHQGEPFFLYLAYNAPHGKWEAPADEQAKLSLERMNPPAGISREFRRTYAAMITRMDAGIGRVLAAIRDQQIEERTLVFFLSDNGGGPNVNAQGNPHYPSSNHPCGRRRPGAIGSSRSTSRRFGRRNSAGERVARFGDKTTRAKQGMLAPCLYAIYNPGPQIAPQIRITIPGGRVSDAASPACLDTTRSGAGNHRLVGLLVLCDWREGRSHSGAVR